MALRVAGHRVALTVILAAQIKDQPGKEQPEGVKHELRDVDIVGDGAVTHGNLSSWSLAGKLEGASRYSPLGYRRRQPHEWAYGNQGGKK